MLDYSLAREDMIVTQLERRGIQDRRVLDAMRSVKRHYFVEPAFRDRAYEDTPLPIEEGQTISQPYVVARMLSLLVLEKSFRVLEIGTGSGYQTAVLSELVHKVFSIERHVQLVQRARRLLEEQGCKNIVLKHGDGTIGWAEFAPYDRVVISAAAPAFPKTLFTQLREGGMMIFPLGERRTQELILVEKVDGEAVMHEAGPVTFVPLIGREGWQNAVS